MEEFQLRFRMSVYKYALFALKTTYRDRQILIFSGIGVILLVIHFLGVNEADSTGTALFAGIGFLLFPLIQFGNLILQVRKSLSVKHELMYKINDAGIVITGTDFIKEYTWDQIISESQSNNFLILQRSATEAIYLPKDLLSPLQQAGIRSKIRK